MSSLDKLLAAVLAVIVILLALGMIGVTVGIVPVGRVVEHITDYFLGYTAVSVAVLLISVKLLGGLLVRTGGTNVVEVEGELGRVTVSYPTIANLTRRVVAENEAISAIRPTISKNKDGLIIRVSGKLAPDSRVPDVSGVLQKRVKEYLENAVGVNVGRVEVYIRDIADASD